jgi:hexokinase
MLDIKAFTALATFLYVCALLLPSCGGSSSINKVLESKFATYYEIDWSKGLQLLKNMPRTTLGTGKNGAGGENQATIPIFTDHYDLRLSKDSSVVVGEWGAGKTYLLEYMKQFLDKDTILIEPMNP